MSAMSFLFADKKNAMRTLNFAIHYVILHMPYQKNIARHHICICQPFKKFPPYIPFTTI